MPLYDINGRRPVLGQGTWIAPSAEIIGDVKIGERCFIGFGAVIRGDFGDIVIGSETAVEDNVVIHAASRAEIGNGVIIGHMAMIHNAVIKDSSLIGMKSMICDDAVIGEWSIIAEQSLVKKGQHVPSGRIFRGSPARETGRLQERHRERLVMGRQAYVDLTARYRKNFRIVD
ncbi:MAG: gamma carbonic anhydrase family protein [Deltaproteobacteria bacterium]|nr:gamma carbonic anhydrase family protein [Deltaproteobacteria bacterium]